MVRAGEPDLTGPVDAHRPATGTPPRTPRREDDQSLLGGAVDWAKDHLDEATTALGWAALAVQIPMARGGGGATRTIRSKLAQQLERTATGSAAVSAARGGRDAIKRSIRAIPAERFAETGVVKGWMALREARMRLGDTKLGKVGIQAQMPIYVGAFGALGSVYLGMDAAAWARGEGSIKDTILHSLMVLPVASEATARVAKVRALTTEAAATERGAEHLAKATQGAERARTAADRIDAPAHVVSSIGRTEAELAGATRTASASADVTASRAHLVGDGSAIPREVDQTLRVGIVRDRVDEIAQRAGMASTAARQADLPLAVRAPLAESRAQAQAAHATLQDGWRHAARSWEAARGAKIVEDVTLKGAYAAFIGNNVDLAAKSALQGHEGDAQSAAIRAARITTLALLIRNEKGGAPSAG